MAVLLRVSERLNLRVRFARPPMPAASDDFSALHHHRTHHWIRRCHAAATPGKPEGEAHELGVNRHL
jgi:hypothetical protein